MGLFQNHKCRNKDAPYGWRRLRAGTRKCHEGWVSPLAGTGVRLPIALTIQAQPDAPFLATAPPLDRRSREAVANCQRRYREAPRARLGREYSGPKCCPRPYAAVDTVA